jgi:hypothetical protein
LVEKRFLEGRRLDLRHSSETFHTLLLLVLLFSGCDLGEPLDSETPSGSSVNGKSIFLKPNGSFVLELDLNACAGYSWYHTITRKSYSSASLRMIGRHIHTTSTWMMLSCKNS